MPQHTKQTILHDPANGKHGNCMSAVLASLLHLPIEDVPIFSDPNRWQIDLNIWLRRYGLAYICLSNFESHAAEYGIVGCHHEIAGVSPRSAEVLHACCAIDGKVTFDPHPDNTGIEDPTKKTPMSGIFIALQPWLAKHF